MQSHNFLTTLKGIFFSFILLSFVMGCSKKTEEELIAPTADFSFTPINPKVNEVITFTNTSKNAVSFEWTAIGTNFNSTEKNPIFTFLTAGDFEVKLVVKNATGETASKTTKISVASTDPNAPIPVAMFSFSPKNPKTGEEVTFINTSANGVSFEWTSTGTTFSSTEKNPKFIFTSKGDFDIKLVAKNVAGQSNESIQKVSVTQTPPLAAFKFLPQDAKIGQEIIFINESRDATSFQWSAQGTSFNSTEKNPKYNFATAGNFEVKLVAKNLAGETNEIIKKITIKTVSSDGNDNPCNLPDCYIKQAEIISSGSITTIDYTFTTVNGKKIISSSSSATPVGNIIISYQYDAEGKQLRVETKVRGTLQNYVTYTYSNGNKTARVETYDSTKTLTDYSIEEYNANKQLEQSRTYTKTNVLTRSTFYSYIVGTNLLRGEQVYDKDYLLVQKSVNAYQNCQLIQRITTDAREVVIEEVNNTLDTRGLLHTSVVNTFMQGNTVTSSTQYVYDCD